MRLDPPVSAEPDEQPQGWDGLSERELIDRARKDREAFGELYRRHYDAMGSYVFRRTGCSHATEEILSDLFLSALQSLPRFKHQGVPIRHWLYRIATHSVTRWLRKQKRGFVSLSTLDPVSEDRAEPVVETPPVLRHLLRMKPKQQAVLSLHYVEGLSVEEVGQVLAIPVGTVKSRLARARDQLAASLQRAERSDG